MNPQARELYLRPHRRYAQRLGDLRRAASGFQEGFTLRDKVGQCGGEVVARVVLELEERGFVGNPVAVLLRVSFRGARGDPQERLAGDVDPVLELLGRRLDEFERALALLEQLAEAGFERPAVMRREPVDAEAPENALMHVDFGGVLVRELKVELAGALLEHGEHFYGGDVGEVAEDSHAPSMPKRFLQNPYEPSLSFRRPRYYDVFNLQIF